MARNLAFALVGALVLAGCASASPAPGTGHASTSATKPTPVQMAQADARELLASFAEMPSAVQLTKAPAAVSGVLAAADPGEGGGPGRAVELTGWFQVPVGYAAAMTEAEAVAPSWARGASAGDSGNGTEGIGAGHSFPGTIGIRDLTISTARLTASSSVVQITIAEGYRPVKPAAERFPGSGILQVVLRPQDEGKPVFTREITDPATVAKVAGLLNALPTMPVPGTFVCTGAEGAATAGPPLRIELGFRTSAGAAASIRASLWQGVRGSWCNGGDGIDVTVGTTSPPALELTPTDVYARLVQALGLPTKGAGS